jgi:hypothetical protein
MTPYTDEWNKWRGQMRKLRGIERSSLKVWNRKASLQAPDAFVPRQGDNFRFVRWGGLGELKLWKKR